MVPTIQGGMNGGLLTEQEVNIFFFILYFDKFLKGNIFLRNWMTRIYSFMGQLTFLILSWISRNLTVGQFIWSMYRAPKQLLFGQSKLSKQVRGQRLCQAA